MNLTVTVALLGWPVASLLLFFWMRPRRAVIASVILGFLFLPVAGLKMTGMPIYTKVMAIGLGPLLGVAVFDLRRLLAFRPGWKDVPMAIWCLSPFVSSLTNDLGVTDGLNEIIYKTTMMGLPYLFGRLYLSSLSGLADLAAGIFLGGLLYIPLCLFEIRMSPQLHTWVYGFYQHEFNQAMRDGGYRPTVFLNHGLMVAMWMTMTTLVGGWLWHTGTLKSLLRIPLPWFLAPLAVTAILCKSMGSLVLMALGIGVLLATRLGRTRFFVIALALLPPLYLGLRIPKLWTGAEMMDASGWVSAERAGSLRFRIVNENLLVDRAVQRPLFGWGGWGRARVRDEWGNDMTVTDSRWIIELGNCGFVGLLSMLAVFTLPLAGLVRAIPVASWQQRLASPAVALAILVLLQLMDFMFNDMPNPAFMMATGGLTCLSVVLVQKKRRPAVLPAAKDPQWSPQSSS